MKKTRLILLLMIGIVGLSAVAQKKKELGEPSFVEASAREATPNVAVFVFPTICDLQMLTNERTNYGPFEYNLSQDLSKMTDEELENNKTRALQDACNLESADLIIEPLYTSIVYERDQKKIFISLSGYPAKYINFRKLTLDDLKTIQTLYPNGVYGIQSQNSGKIITTASEGSK